MGERESDSTKKGPPLASKERGACQGRVGPSNPFNKNLRTNFLAFSVKDRYETAS
jgi:hypothetical protein